MSLGKRIQECREGLGLSQAALAKRLGVSQSTVGNYEAGISFPREEVLLRLFDSLPAAAGSGSFWSRTGACLPWGRRRWAPGWTRCAPTGTTWRRERRTRSPV